jgi:hypothetical protein
MPWPIFNWNASTGGWPTIVGWSGSTSTNVNPGVGLRVTDPNSPNYGKVLGSSDTMALIGDLEKGKGPKVAQDSYDASKRQLSYNDKPKVQWLILLLAAVIGYSLLKRK